MTDITPLSPVPADEECRVLIFPAGTEIGLEIYAALSKCRNLRLFGAGEDVSNPARFVFPNYHHVTSVHGSGWLAELIALCRALDIGYIFPAHDDAIVALSENRDQIPATLVTSSKDTCLATRSKSITYRRLGTRVRVPAVFENAADISAYPVLIKPDKGQGSRGVHRIDSAEQLQTILSANSGSIICEYLPGEEYTVDCFSSTMKGLLFVGARIRNRVRNGISVNTKTVELPEAWQMAQAIHDEFKPRGAWFFQLKRDKDGRLAVLEVAPRIAGAMAAHRVTGINFPLLSLMDSKGIDVRIEPNAGTVEMDRCLHSRYRHGIRFRTLYIDLDDSLLCGGQVDLDLVKLIFACINRKQRVVLLTRHAGNLHSTLASQRLAALFDEVIHITDASPKSKFITDHDSVFVDDSFSERQEVARNCGIPTFDMSMLELLCETARDVDLSSTDSPPTGVG